jgi:hypothetical protein
MTPKEKAIELSQKYLLINKNVSKHWKECALTAVDEIIDLVKHIDVDSEDYWQEVKQEIINL